MSKASVGIVCALTSIVLAGCAADIDPQDPQDPAQTLAVDLPGAEADPNEEAYACNERNTSGPPVMCGTTAACCTNAGWKASSGSGDHCSGSRPYWCSGLGHHTCNGNYDCYPINDNPDVGTCGSTSKGSNRCCVELNHSCSPDNGKSGTRGSCCGGLKCWLVTGAYHVCQ